MAEREGRVPDSPKRRRVRVRAPSDEEGWKRLELAKAARLIVQLFDQRRPEALIGNPQRGSEED